MPQEAIVSLVVVLLVVFLIGREVVCWYFKLSRIATALDKIHFAQLKADKADEELKAVLIQTNQLLGMAVKMGDPPALPPPAR